MSTFLLNQTWLCVCVSAQWPVINHVEHVQCVDTWAANTQLKYIYTFDTWKCTVTSHLAWGIPAELPVSLSKEKGNAEGVFTHLWSDVGLVSLYSCNFLFIFFRLFRHFENSGEIWVIDVISSSPTIWPYKGKMAPFFPTKLELPS